MGEGTRFAFQHDARRLPDGTISIFDNGSLVFESGIPKAVEESRAIVLDLAMPRHDIADYLGLTLETVSRMFAALKEMGTISLESARRVHLLDTARLKAMSA